MDNYRQGIAEHIPKIVVEFFATFSRYEFALKRSGFLIGEVGKKAKPDWDDFATKLGTDFFTKIRAAQEAQILFREQPKSLKVANGGTVAFETPATIINGKMLFEAVRLVRNNLLSTAE